MSESMYPQPSDYTIMAISAVVSFVVGCLAGIFIPNLWGPGKFMVVIFSVFTAFFVTLFYLEKHCRDHFEVKCGEKPPPSQNDTDSEV